MSKKYYVVQGMSKTATVNIFDDLDKALSYANKYDYSVLEIEVML